MTIEEHKANFRKIRTSAFFEKYIQLMSKINYHVFMIVSHRQDFRGGKSIFVSAKCPIYDECVDEPN